jgi:hypothetical protein
MTKPIKWQGNYGLRPEHTQFTYDPFVSLIADVNDLWKNKVKM